MTECMTKWMTRRNTPANHPRERDDPAPGILRVTAHSTPSPVSAGRGSPLRGRLRVPGDKSISHRALILGLLAIGETRVEGLLEGEDVMRTAEACRALGAGVARTGPGSWRVTGAGIGGLDGAGGPSRFRQCRHRRAAHDGRRRQPPHHRHLRRRCVPAQAPHAAHPRPARADGNDRGEPGRGRARAADAARPARDDPDHLRDPGGVGADQVGGAARRPQLARRHHRGRARGDARPYRAHAAPFRRRGERRAGRAARPQDRPARPADPHGRADRGPVGSVLCGVPARRRADRAGFGGRPRRRHDEPACAPG